MIGREQALSLIFEDLRGGLDEPADGAVPLIRLIEELSAGFQPTQELFDELVRSLCSGYLELCDDTQHIRIRNAGGDVRAGLCLWPDCQLKMGDLAALAAAFAPFGLAQAEESTLENQAIGWRARCRATKP